MEPPNQTILAEAATWYYDVCELYEDEDLDPDDHLEVIRRAFCSSDCNEFAAVLGEMTGWQTVIMSWQDAEQEFWGHHTLVRSPEGQLLDVTGWVTEKELKKRYGLGGARLKPEFKDAEPMSCMLGIEIENGIDENKQRIASVIRALPWGPFNEPWFQEITGRPLPGVDVPLPGDEPSASPRPA